MKLDIDTKHGGRLYRINELRMAMIEYDESMDDTKDYSPSREPEPIMFRDEEMRL